MHSVSAELLMAADKKEKSQLHKVALRGSSKQVAEFVRLPQSF